MTRSVCLHCGKVPCVPLPAHLRDTGDAVRLPEGSCPVLFKRRRGRLVRTVGQ